VELGLVGQAVGMLAVTNVDDGVIMALFFGQNRGTTRWCLGSTWGSPESWLPQPSVRWG
jgi:hypothetical protein